MRIDGKPYRTIWLGADGRTVEILDQTRFPHAFDVVALKTLDDAARAIKDMQVRGAPLIGVTAAYGMALAMHMDASDAMLDRASATLMATRPTAVNLRWALDEMLVYRLDTKRGMLALDNAPLKLQAGLGPRHFAFHPKGKFAYSVNELGSSVTAMSWNQSTGTLKDFQTISTLPADFKGESYCAEIVVHPNGRWLYASNRGHQSIAVFEINPANGQLTARGQVKTGGEWPRNFNLDPTGRWLLAANERSDSLVVFTVDQKTGDLKQAGEIKEVGAPVCVKFLRRK